MRLVRRALVRSRVQLRILFALLALRDAYVPDLAREARTSEQWVMGALFGDGRNYRIGMSLVRLRLVAWRRDEVGIFVWLTPFGARVARAWRADAARVLSGGTRSAHA